ncbi:MAG: vanadium-dependent haloperoxidase [Bacteroidia bacterium]|nr:vanadium-dependent haloperoxidase [Bacteroidia bacterium]
MRIKTLRYFVYIAASLIFLGNGCTPDDSWKTSSQDPEILHKCVKNLTNIIVYDIFSPPVASRIYTYTNIAAYEVLVKDHPEYKSLAGQLTGLEAVPAPDTTREICYPLAAIQSFLTVSRTMVFSEDKLSAYEKDVMDQFRSLGVPSDVFQNSLDYGTLVGKHILDWSSKDNYKQSRTFPKYTVDNKQPARWTPTPPDYMDAIEPHWSRIRPFVIDSATQFIPVRPTDFSTDTTSQFFKEMREVYNIGKNLTEEQKNIAQFWDCNPFVTHHQGHVMFATKKITPGGHWMGISLIACRKEKTDIMRSSEVYTRTAIALADAFISCWDEKYRSVMIRPETVINQYLDEEWRPLLQTPPFPEYTSGHSVISSSAATVLTDLFGEPFAFVDSTEKEYGLPERSFNSFLEASAEAAVSRMYGGIHYRPACENGVVQGKKVGTFIVENLKTREAEQAN